MKKLPGRSLESGWKHGSATQAGAFPPAPPASARSRLSEAETEARREGGSASRCTWEWGGD